VKSDVDEIFMHAFFSCMCIVQESPREYNVETAASQIFHKRWTCCVVSSSRFILLLLVWCSLNSELNISVDILYQ
jgi:hypothetical protein